MHVECCTCSPSGIVNMLLWHWTAIEVAYTIASCVPNKFVLPIILCKLAVVTPLLDRNFIRARVRQTEITFPTCTSDTNSSNSLISSYCGVSTSIKKAINWFGYFTCYMLLYYLLYNISWKTVVTAHLFWWLLWY
jgi:hypothetical protein